jgi:hypothetical protein
MAGKTVRVWEGLNKFGLIFEDENLSIVFRESEDFPFAFEVRVYEGEELVEKDLIKYEDEDVGDIYGLKEKLLQNPEKVLKDVLGKEIKVERVLAW